MILLIGTSERKDGEEQREQWGACSGWTWAGSPPGGHSDEDDDDDEGEVDLGDESGDNCLGLTI